MAWYREKPDSFVEALRAARELLSASQELVAKGSIETEAEQLVLAAYRAVSGKLLSRVELFSRAQDRFPAEAGEKLMAMAGARAEGKLLQHLTGVQFFLEHEYEVGPDVLVPRPETELMVSLVIEELKREELKREELKRAGLKGQADAPVLGLEIGVGSGAISIELLAEFPKLTMLASELTAEAESRARSNAQRILGEPDRLKIYRAQTGLQVWEPLAAVLGARRADFVISNPPYLIDADPIETEVRTYEPATALFAPAGDPLHFYREIALNAGRHLVAGGKAFVELAPERAADVLRLFQEAGWQARLLPDLNQRDRLLFASLAEKR